MLVALAAAMLAAEGALAQATESVYTTVADFEDDSVATTIGAVRNVVAADCLAKRASIPARGKYSLAIELGATTRGVSAACGLVLRVPLRVSGVERIGTFAFIKGAPVRVAFQLRDARGRVFETALCTTRDANRWIALETPATPDALKRVSGDDGPLEPPIQIDGYRVECDEIGRQAVFLDDLYVQHRVGPTESILGDFAFDAETRLYEPGAAVRAVVSLENRSRDHATLASIELAWIRGDGAVVKTDHRTNVNLPASGVDYRSRQPIDFSQKIAEPGLYRLVARVRAAGWLAPAVFESTIAVTPSNRLTPRGRATFFGMRANLLRESNTDRLREVDLAREVGVQMLVVDTPWRGIQPAEARWELAELDTMVQWIAERDMALLLALTDPPDWAVAAPNWGAALQQSLEFLAKRYGSRVRAYQVLDDATGGKPASAASAGEMLRALRAAVARSAPDARVLSAALPLPLDDRLGFSTKLFSDSALNWCFETTVSAGRAAALRAAAGERLAAPWSAHHWWQQRGTPRADAGVLDDAEQVLRQHVAAAASGVGGMIWSELRDDDNDPAIEELLTGLVRRDFSPRLGLLGYASTAGTLAGLRYAGSIEGTPPEFESAIFCGSDRQVAVILPRPNRVLPAFLMPQAGAAGTMQLQDFLRGDQPLVRSLGPPLVPCSDRAQFVTLRIEKHQDQPQISFAQPWLRLPSRVYLAEAGTIPVELTAPRALKGAAAQLVLSAKCGLESSAPAAALNAESGATVRVDLPLRVSDPEFRRTRAIVRLALGAAPLDVPVDVLREFVCPAATTINDAAPPLATLDGPPRGSARVAVRTASKPSQIALRIDIEDDAFMPRAIGRDGRSTGDELVLGWALAGVDEHVEVLITTDAHDAALLPIHGTCADQLRGWSARAQRAEDGKSMRVELTIPAAPAGRERDGGSRRFLLALRYRDDDGSPLGADEYSLGAGLTGERSTRDFVALRCPAGN